MIWLASKGIISGWSDFEALPAGVYEDALMLMEADGIRTDIESRRRR